MIFPRYLFPPENHMACIVTAYFDIPSKHPSAKYHEWIRNFLLIKTSIIVFTDNRQFIESNRSPNLPIHIVDTTFTDFHTHQYCEQWKEQHTMDPEQKIHNIKLYMIWNEKSNFIKRAIDINPFECEYFYWMDIGSFRQRHRMNHFLEIPTRTTNKILLLQIHPFTFIEKQLFDQPISNPFIKANRIGGGIFGGHTKTCLQWHTYYYDMLHYFITHRIFAGKDQSIMAIIAIMHPDLVQLVPPKSPRWDPWFYLQEWLCQPDDHKS